MEFVCPHCDGRLLGIADIGDKTITVECLSCGKESVIERKVVSTPPVKLPDQIEANNARACPHRLRPVERHAREGGW